MMKKLFSATLMLGALAACQPQEPPLDILGPVPELGHGLMEGYLHGDPPLNSAAFVPAPPSEGTARQQADDAASEALRSLRRSARWDQAARDADASLPCRDINIRLCTGRHRQRVSDTCPISPFTGH